MARMMILKTGLLLKRKSVFLLCTVWLTALAGCNEATIHSIENSGSEVVENAEGEGFEDVSDIYDVLPPERPLRGGEERQVASIPSENPTQPAPPPSRMQPVSQDTPKNPVSQTLTRPDDPREIVARANDYFNGFRSLSGSFTQVSSNGKKQTGQLYLLRPGRMRFDYDAPSALQLVADGQHVAIRNTSSGRQDLYPLSQTPLKFLLNSQTRLDRDLKVVRAWAEKDGTVLTLEDRSTLGGTSRITLFFDPTMQKLKSWDVTDTQGKKTSVYLGRLSMNTSVDAADFVIPNKSRER